MNRFPRIDLFDFNNRKEEIAEILMKAASEHGFFYVVNHDIPVKCIRNIFGTSHSFFELPESIKERYPMDHPRNAGWENLSQNCSAEYKESMQFSFHSTSDLRPSEKDVPGLNHTVEDFMVQCNNVSQQLLVCFAIGLGFPQEFFTRCHDISQPDCLNSLRCIRYLHHSNQTEQKKLPNIGTCRTGAHTNINTFSLLFQQPGQNGLEIYYDNEWTSITLKENEIICNIGDMIVRWSDDRLQSRSHRVRNQASSKYHGPRSIIEYVNEANRSVIIQGRTKYTKPITAGEILMTSMEKNYIALKAAQASSAKSTLKSHTMVIA